MTRTNAKSLIPVLGVLVVLGAAAAPHQGKRREGREGRARAAEGPRQNEAPPPRTPRHLNFQ